jgi:UDP-N-acetyl-D-mannosaminuronic acid dehydrogenase
MKKKNYDICIIGGLGHVGLPLGISFAKSGRKVILYDINQKAIDTVRKGIMPFLETGAEEILKDVLDKALFITDDKKKISESNFIIVVIGTPVDEHLNPEFTIFKKFFDGILDEIQDDQHIILRSTVFPGTTEKIKQYLESKGKRVKLSFCPERIAEGKAMEELRSLPQIVSAFDDISFTEAKDLYSSLTKDIIFLSPVEAELAKLFTNVWRYIQFAISNQFYQIATGQGLDFYKIFNAITYKYPRTQSFPGAGFAAGPCLFKDTMQLSSYSNNNFILGHIAMLINEGLPNFIVQHLKEKHDVSDKVIGILGMAFKGNSDDRRESLSYKLKKILEIEAKKVLCSDIYIKESEFVSATTLIRDADIIILAAPHKGYSELKIKNKIVVDIWNFWGKGGAF